MLTGSVVPGASASVFVVSTVIRKERCVDCLILPEPCDDACNVRVLKVPSWKGVGSVPDTHEAREGGGLIHRDWFWLTDILHSGLRLASPLAKDAQTIVWMPNH